MVECTLRGHVNRLDDQLSCISTLGLLLDGRRQLLQLVFRLEGKCSDKLNDQIMTLTVLHPKSCQSHSFITLPFEAIDEDLDRSADALFLLNEEILADYALVLEYDTILYFIKSVMLIKSKSA